MAVKMEIHGTTQAKKFLKFKEKQVTIKSVIGLNKAAIFMQGEVKLSIAGERPEPQSVDTGRFLNSVDVDIGKTDATIFSKIPYAKFLEFGTSKIKPRRHFQNSKDRNKQNIKEIIAKEISKI